MDIPKLSDTLKFDEGARRLPNGRHRLYADTVGQYTIGWGRDLSANGISEDEAELMLSNDIQQAVDDCQGFRWFGGLDDVRQRVIVEMSFALGAPRLLGFHKMLEAMAVGNYATAAEELLDSRWAGQVGDRATRLADMLRSGVDTLL